MNKTVQEPVRVLPVGKNVVMLGENPNLSISECSSVGRTPTAVLVAEGRRGFESFHSDFEL